MTHDILLHGIDGANPLGFLAAIGTLRVLSLDAGGVRLRWKKHENAWRPVLALDTALDEHTLVERLSARLATSIPPEVFALGDNPSVPLGLFRSYAQACAQAAWDGDRLRSDFAVAFAGEYPVDKNGKVPDTALRTMSGAGHQHFLKFMCNFIEQVQPEHLHKALFATWRYDDPVQNMTLRWDPSDDNRYALRWSDPSGDPDRKSTGSMWGANRLAIEALPLLPTLPTHRQLETTGFHTQGARKTHWTWPIWNASAGVDTVRSLLDMAAVHRSGQPGTQPQGLAARGIVEVYRSRRLTTGKFRNFTMGTPVSYI
ncbi:MAG: hypothetical protein ABS82_08200 [Rhodanobacter sp. SCN 67-45]|nr:MAG: hypothetical protein ABS82_08200 [Rhodanobacter sp. SCN 67-45]